MCVNINRSHVCGAKRPSLACLSLPSSLTEAGIPAAIHCYVCQAEQSMSSRNSLVSTSHLSTAVDWLHTLPTMLGYTWALGVLSQALSHIKPTLPVLSHFPLLSFMFSLKFHSVYFLIPCYFKLYFPFPKCCFDLLCCLNFLLNWISFKKSLVPRHGVFSSGWTFLGFRLRQQLLACILPLILSLQLTVPSLSVCCFCGWFLFLSVTSAVFLCDCAPMT